ncbi:hypothetical protein [Sphingopyxis sp. BSNA05]|uniref:hypothetical protein n=1 Tax=Sphingopyxis sp. BSNA05 TaxID=1236614 RepID=UPI001564B2AC|nr:hypothetical protein [Sphingopyxis sp. BSNA05]
MELFILADAFSRKIADIDLHSAIRPETIAADYNLDVDDVASFCESLSTTTLLTTGDLEITPDGMAYVGQHWKDCLSAAKEYGDKDLMKKLEDRFQILVSGDPSIHATQDLENQLDGFGGMIGQHDFVRNFQQLSYQTMVTAFIRKAYSKLDEIGLPNSDVAQAKAYLECALILSEAPVPQPSLVWELCERASHIAGVSSLLIALFVALVG